MSGSWAIDAGLAADLIEALGWDPASGAAALSERLPHVVLCGSTAKLAAIRDGAIPPGADVEGLARTVLALDRSRRSAPPVASPAWSCWVLAPLHAALVDATGVGRARVAAIRRIDEGPKVAPVDLHSAVTVEADGSTVVCDPYFGLAAELPREPGEIATAGPHPGAVEVMAGADGRWELAVRLARWDEGFRYRLLAPDLDPGDVHALCAISVHSSGVPARPYARIHDDASVIEVQESGSGTFAAQRWTGVDGEMARTDRVDTATWGEAVAAFEAWTGIRPT